MSKAKGRRAPLISSDTIARVDAIRSSSRSFLQKEGQDNESSSDSDEDCHELVTKALSGYCSELNGIMAPNDLLKVALHDHSCLICLSGIRRSQAVWSCKLCYCLFHLVCIQQWARDGVMIKNPVLSQDLFPNLSISWSCPKCRGEYDRAETPSLYKCFCGNQVDPSSDPWVLAHSCGEVCGRDLKPLCGHKCLSLCHPGPCPPCPKTLYLSCYCKQSPKIAQRCGLPGWSCKKVCKKTLSCGLHTCEQHCHPGSCDPCAEQVMQTCLCGKRVGKHPCDDPLWSCGDVCGRVLACGQHFCQKECHAGTCGDCPRKGERACPCGKKEYFISDCSFEVPCCGDTCSKALNCGRHKCVRQCHIGDCGPCLEKAEKVCRCGQKKKFLSCNQDFLCENRCQSMRQCGRHQCRRKCCDGHCAPCEQVCGRALGCKTHKCPAPCHSGRCYPCVLTVPVTCACGKTATTVPCGRERVTKPPRCKQPCLQPPLCHHTKASPHRCHFGDCPPCQQTCSIPLSCGHSCTATCHSRPSVSQIKPVVPWKKAEVSVTVAKCPPCVHPVSKYCLGEHEVLELPCSESHDYSCGQSCHRVLECGNHTCKRGCHLVINSSTTTSSGEDCLQCEEPCKKTRSSECHHPCPLPCHQGDCPPCSSLLKVPCHCSTIQIYIKCSEWCGADVTKREYMKTCNSQCSRKLSCGHFCLKSCHPGPCSPVQECRRRITVRCPCRRIKKEWRCNERKDLVCNEECFIILQEQKEIADKAAADAFALKEKEKKESLEALERRLRPRKRRSKVETVHPDRVTSVRRNLFILVVGFLCLIFILFCTL